MSASTSTNFLFASLTSSAIVVLGGSSVTATSWNVYVSTTMTSSSVTFTGSSTSAKAGSGGLLYVGTTSSAVGVLIASSAVVSAQSSATSPQISLLGAATQISLTVTSAASFST